jgi:hypothetical protein
VRRAVCDLGFRVPLDLQRQLWATAAVLKAILACALFLLSACNRSPQATARPGPLDTPNSEPRFEARSPELPDCDLPPKKLEAAKESGHHRVMLTWNPSSSSSGLNDQSVGYCLYRSGDSITAHDLDDCLNCGRLNRRPIIGTGCLDTQVKDGATYYYVAGATRFGSRVIQLSNMTTAFIPSTAQSKQPESGYPLCQVLSPSPAPVPAANP